MSIHHPMPTARIVLDRIEVVPVRHVSVAFPQGRIVWLGKVWCNIYEKPVYCTREYFSPVGALLAASTWAVDAGYM